MKGRKAFHLLALLYLFVIACYVKFRCVSRCGGTSRQSVNMYTFFAIFIPASPKGKKITSGVY